MPRRILLTWFAPRQCWKKKHGGKVYYLKAGAGQGKSNPEGYRAALDEWEGIKAHLDQTTPEKPHERFYRAAIADRLTMERWFRSHPESDPEGRQLAAAVQERQALQTELAKAQPKPLDASDLFILRRAPMQDQKMWVDRLAQMEAAQQPTANTVGKLVKRFLDQQRQRVALGELSAGRADNLRISLEAFRDLIGQDAPIYEVGNSAVERFYLWLVERIKAKQIGKTTAKDYLADLRQFFRKVAKRYVEDWNCPKNYDDSDFTFRAVAKESDTWTDDELIRLFKFSPPRFRLYWLLMLNCGMGQKDVADLLDSEVDWAKGTITRVRSKNQHRVGSDEDQRQHQVCWNLWPETFDLLKQFRSGGERVLLNEAGQPLWHNGLNEDGKQNKTDCIGRDFHRDIKPKAKVEKRLYELRKTAYNLLRDGKYRQYKEIYLAHAAKGVSERHYDGKQGLGFRLAIQWLRTQLGIPKLAKQQAA